MNSGGSLVPYEQNLVTGELSAKLVPIAPLVSDKPIDAANPGTLVLNGVSLPFSGSTWHTVNMIVNVLPPEMKGVEFVLSSNVCNFHTTTTYNSPIDLLASNAFSVQSAIPDNTLAYRKLGEKVEELLYLPKNWNGYDGVAPSARTVFEARHVLGLVPNKFPVPHVMNAGSGEVAFFWEKGSKYLEIGFEGDGAYYYFSDGLDQDIQADACSVVTTVLPSNLLAALDTFS
jgi:hypothetical protein